MPRQADYQIIESQQQLDEFCGHMEEAEFIGFDTEFVSEDCYQPELCLVQVATEKRAVLIDPYEVDAKPFWQALSAGNHQTVVHSGREEFLFSLRYAGARPQRLFDIQIAAGLIGLDYPASYATLVQKLASKTLGKGETRTDWRRRPLSRSQLDYAANDVVFLEKIYRKLLKRLDGLGRLEWMDEEMLVWQDELQKQATSHVWRRVSGVASLDRRSLAIARELWSWRDEVAAEKNQPPRRILRDDLLVEISKRKTSSAKSIRSIRGMERRSIDLDAISAAVERGQQLPDSELPHRSSDSKVPTLGALGQFLGIAMSVICRQHKLAPSLFGSIAELRKIAAWKIGQSAEPDSRLLAGWRGRLLLPILEQILSGQIAIRVNEKQDDALLDLIQIGEQRFESIESDEPLGGVS